LDTDFSREWKFDDKKIKSENERIKKKYKINNVPIEIYIPYGWMGYGLKVSKESPG
jgi:hypothetical protein